MKQQLLKLAAEEMKVDPSSLRISEGVVTATNDPSKKLRIMDIQGLKSRGVIVGIGYRGPNPADKVIVPFCAQFCEVEVNIGTGEVKILRFLSANDSGRVMDRLTYHSQVVGGITVGIGLTVTEMRVLDASQTGKMLNKNCMTTSCPQPWTCQVRSPRCPLTNQMTRLIAQGARASESL